MEKKGSGLLPVIWALAVAVIRIVYAVLGSQTITDPFGFFSHAMIQEQEREPLLSSGISYAYTESLSDVLRFTGNRIEIVRIYQILLLILWLVLFFFAARILLGNTAALVSSILLTVWPWGAFGRETAVECENYLMLFWALFLLLLGIFRDKVRASGWNRSNFCELYLMLTGFGMGVVTAWNYMGLLFIPVIIFVLVQNHAVMKEQIWLRDWESITKESKRPMSIPSQGFILFTGMFLGMYAVLMKYTGLTGQVLFEQFFWWLDQFRNFPDRCQDISAQPLTLILTAVAAGCLCQMLVLRIQRKAASKKAFREESAKGITAGKEKKTEKQQDEVIEKDAGEWADTVITAAEAMWDEEEIMAPEEAEKVTATADAEKVTATADAEKTILPEKIKSDTVSEEVKKVRYLDNPLPVPPKREIKDLEFDIEVNEEDDFEI